MNEHMYREEIILYKILPDEDEVFSDRMRCNPKSIGKINPNYRTYSIMLSQAFFDMNSDIKEIESLKDLYYIPEGATVSIGKKLTGVMLSKRGGLVTLIGREQSEQSREVG